MPARCSASTMARNSARTAAASSALDGSLATGGGRVGRLGRERVERVVAPVVDQAAREQVAFADVLVHRQQADGGDAQALQVRQHRRVGQRGVAAAKGFGHLGVQAGERLHVRFVDHHAVARHRRARRDGLAGGPLGGRVHHHALGHGRGVVVPGRAGARAQGWVGCSGSATAWPACSARRSVLPTSARAQGSSSRRAGLKRWPASPGSRGRGRAGRTAGPRPDPARKLTTARCPVATSATRPVDRWATSNSSRRRRPSPRVPRRQSARRAARPAPAGGHPVQGWRTPGSLDCASVLCSSHPRLLAAAIQRPAAAASAPADQPWPCRGCASACTRPWLPTLLPP